MKRGVDYFRAKAGTVYSLPSISVTADPTRGPWVIREFMGFMQHGPVRVNTAMTGGTPEFFDSKFWRFPVLDNNKTVPGAIYGSDVECSLCHSANAKTSCFNGSYLCQHCAVGGEIDIDNIEYEHRRLLREGHSPDCARDMAGLGLECKCDQDYKGEFCGKILSAMGIKGLSIE